MIDPLPKSQDPLSGFVGQELYNCSPLFVSKVILLMDFVVPTLLHVLEVVEFWTRSKNIRG